ncbi:MAG: hypothetical protein ABIJ31_08635 [Pseudomonadota bacterium]
MKEPGKPLRFFQALLCAGQDKIPGRPMAVIDKKQLPTYDALKKVYNHIFFRMNR